MMKNRKFQQGFSLIELMIAVTLSLVAMLAATELYIGTRQTYKIQGMQTRLSEDGRFAISMLQRIISQAGYRPSPSDVMISNYLTPTSAQSATVRFTADGANTMLCNGSLGVANTAYAPVIALSGNKLQCDAVDWIAPATAGSGNGTELVDFRLFYGTDTSPVTTYEFGCGTNVFANGTADTSSSPGFRKGDCVADSFLQATATANPSAIVSVRVCLVLRSEAVDASLTKAAAVNDCAGTAIANSQTDNKLYRTFRSTVMLRNR